MLRQACKIRYVAIVLMLLSHTSLYSQSAAALQIDTLPADANIPISNWLYVLPDDSGNLSFEEISSPEFQNRFRQEPAWAKSAVKTHWLRLEVRNNLTADEHLLAYIQASTVDLFEEGDDHHYSKKSSGLLVPLPDRDQKNRFGHLPYISILLRHGTTRTYYWKVSMKNFPIITPHTNLPPALSSVDYVLDKSRSSFFFFVSICSILFGLALYHLVIFIVTRDRVYLFFTLYSLTACLYIMYFKGYLLEFIFPTAPGLHYTLGFTVVCISFHLALLAYVRKYLALKSNFPAWDRFLLISFSVIVLVIAVTMLTTFLPPLYFLTPVLVLPIIILEALGFTLIKARHPFAWNYFAAFSLLVIGTVLNGVFSVAGIEQNVWDFGDIGILGLQVLLAAGLALRINHINTEKQIAQAELIHRMRDYQLLQDQTTSELEEKVKKRTIEIETQNEKLTRLNLLKDKLFSIISHDIKGPLNQLSSTLYMMERDMITKDEIKVLVPQIRTNLAANSNFITELLTWAKSQLEGARLNPQAANLQDLIESNFQLLKPIADAKGIRLTSKLSDPLSIYADVEMIKSVVRNLSANAIKFTNPRGEIEITVGVDQTFASIVVQDNGKGISVENQKKLFGSQIFTTLGTANEKGTGIGLLLCKDFVEKNGGRIWVESEEGKGSKFAFTVPLNKN